jgi:limonene-1,2-epoxide hydrolase
VRHVRGEATAQITLWRDYFDLASATLQLVTSPVRTLLRMVG